MTPGCDVLVAILNNVGDMNRAREEHWYRIPVESVDRYLKSHWPPRWLAFYQTKVFQEDAYAVRYYARVLHISKVQRGELFPDEPTKGKSDRFYYKLEISNLEVLPCPIISLRRRRISFITTTLEKLQHATEINDLKGD